MEAKKYAVRHRLTEKPVVDHPLVKLFSLGVTAEASRTNIDWKSPFLRGGKLDHFDPKFKIEVDIPHQSFMHG